MITHRDPCMAYQCLECGKSFVVKPSFSTHLLLEHGISDVQEYIDKKPCYNELALLKDQNVLNPPVDEPVKENQCRVCREQFETSNELEKHFRVHGMAFLLKNARKKSIQP
ncbi:jg22893 [Pararge aegeria aegeria]|uniref:Jg22893 protein n=4 Tax=Pararge aegeria TaxID=116150 RepID=A0A8S4RXY6_9NEOP|nr:jg22893 [Pararge aegeria aegeria]